MVAALDLVVRLGGIEFRCNLAFQLLWTPHPEIMDPPKLGSSISRSGVVVKRPLKGLVGSVEWDSPSQPHQVLRGWQIPA